MKKIVNMFVSIMAVAIIAVTMTSCSCKHEWEKATCDKPKTCKLCGETEGSVLAHEFEEATCTDPKICKLCGKTRGDAKGHDFAEATCTLPQICTVCQAEEGEPLGHKIVVDRAVKATCTTDGLTEGKHCRVCNTVIVEQKEIVADGHSHGSWKTVTEPTLIKAGEEEKRCTDCDKVLDSRTIEKKKPAAAGMSFNFKDKEFVEWLNAETSLTVGTTELIDSNDSPLEDGDNTVYSIKLSSGISGLLILTHEDSKKDNNICTIRTYFGPEGQASAIATAVYLGSCIDSRFSFDAAAEKVGSGGIYSAANITATSLEMDDDFIVGILLPSEFVESLIDD